MYSRENNLAALVKIQYRYKLHAFINHFFHMVIVHVFALLMSAGGTMSTGTGLAGGVMLTVKGYSADILIVFSFLWIFLTAIITTTKEYRNMDFALVSNRLSGNLSNILFLLTASLLGAISATLGGILLRLVVYFFRSDVSINPANFVVPPQVLFLTILVAALYLVLFGSAGYLAGTLAQVNKLFAVLLPVLFLGSLIYDVNNNQGRVYGSIAGFFFKEASLALLAVKILVVATAFFCLAIVLSNRLEVRK